MVTLESLKKQIKKQEDRLADIKKQNDLEFQKSTLSKQLKTLKRSPGTTKNIQIARRTARGFKRLALIGGKALIKQAKLIKDQQLREDAALSKRGKTITKRAKRAGKKIRKASKKRSKKLSKKGAGKSVTLTFA